jgi:hypothetical protein
MSLGFDELGLASADIQFVMPLCPYSKARVVLAPGVTSSLSATRTQGLGAQDMISQTYSSLPARNPPFPTAS